MRIESVAESARRHIQEWIDTGILMPGEQLKEEELASRLNISRPPIREAFKDLEAIGLVVRKPRRGVFVVELAQKDMWEVYTLKAHLYELGLQIAFSKLSAAHLNALRGQCDEMQRCVRREPPDIQRYQHVHHAFHDLILEVSGHQRLIQFASSLHQQVRRYSYLAFHEPGHLEASLEAHQRIVAAIAKKQLKQACRLMREHVLDGLLVLSRRFKPDEIVTSRASAVIDDEVSEPRQSSTVYA